MNLRKNAHPSSTARLRSMRHAIANGGQRGQELHQKEHADEDVQQARVRRQEIEDLGGRGERARAAARPRRRSRSGPALDSRSRSTGERRRRGRASRAAAPPARARRAAAARAGRPRRAEALQGAPPSGTGRAGRTPRAAGSSPWPQQPQRVEVRGVASSARAAARPAARRPCACRYRGSSTTSR